MARRRLCVGNYGLFCVMACVCLLGGCDSPKISERVRPKTKEEQRAAKEMRVYWQKYLSIEPTNAEEYLQRGNAHYVFGDFEAAREDYDVAKGMYEALADYESIADVDARLEALRRQSL